MNWHRWYLVGGKIHERIKTSNRGVSAFADSGMAANKKAMKRTIRTSLCVLIILVVNLCLLVGGCHKKLIRDQKVGFVEGFVKHSVNLTPILDAEILDGAPPDTIFITKTDSTGYYKFGNFPIKMVVTAFADGYELQTKTVEIIEKGTTRLDFFLNGE